MKTFKQMIVEGRDAPLYHGTNKELAVKILKSNSITTSVADQDHRNVVSLTRDLQFAISWGYIQGSEPVVFQIDQRKLAQSYSIKLYDYHYNFLKLTTGGRRIAKSYDEEMYPNESEEYVLKTIQPLDKYLMRILVNYSDLDYIPKVLRNHPLLCTFSNPKVFINQ